MKDVLVVEDDELCRDFLASSIEAKGLSVCSCDDGQQARRALETGRFRLVITDLKLPGADGIAILKKVRSDNPTTDVIVVTGHGSVETAVECMKQGAFDFLLKPVSRTRLEALVERALERQDLIAETKTLRRMAAAPSTRGEIICKSKQMQSVMELVRAVADTDSTVLVRGESGVGKELVASSIHNLSRRAGGPLVCVNCGALPEGLLESELFGHERGAFTSAVARKPGMFELADRGTIFLDEIGELSPALQVKLLRVLESHKFKRVGGTRTIEADVRVISATNRDLEKARKAHLFREDLYFRLNVVEIVVPPLRNRREDIPLIIDALLNNISSTSQVPRKSVSPEAMECIARFTWPGNVRELQNALERALVVCKGDEIKPCDLPNCVAHAAVASPAAAIARLPVQPAATAASAPAALQTLDEIEAEYVQAALAACDGNKSKAAKMLGIDRGTLARKLRISKKERAQSGKEQPSTVM